MSNHSPSSQGTNPPTVTWTERLEADQRLDPVVRKIQPLANALVADPARRAALRGTWLGHALHPLMTDLPIGFWTSAITLDLVGGDDAQTAARRLVGLGVLSAVPTAVTGWAEWAGTEPRVQRVGVVHAASNVVGLLLFASSWRARKHGHGRKRAMTAVSVLGLGGYLGGHMVSARKVSSRHPAFES
jgi:uncharacterized membrane protein